MNFPRSTRGHEAPIQTERRASLGSWQTFTAKPSDARRSLAPWVCSAIACSASVISSYAHPGHGPGEVPPTHLVTSADHLGMLLAVAVIGFCLVNGRRWFNRNPKAT